MIKEDSSSKMSLEMMVRYYRVSVMAGLAVVVLLFLGWNQITGILNQQKTYTKQRAQLADLNKRLGVLRGQSESGFDQIKKVVNRALPPEKPVFEAFSALSSLAGETGVVLSELSSTPGSLATASASTSTDRGGGFGAKSMVMKLSIEGEERQVNEYLSQVIRLVPIVDLNTVKLSRKNSEGDEAPRYTMELDVSVYWMPKVKVTANDGAPIQELTEKQQETIQDLLGYRYYGIN